LINFGHLECIEFVLLVLASQVIQIDAADISELQRLRAAALATAAAKRVASGQRKFQPDPSIRSLL
jgi:hypothetical protein